MATDPAAPHRTAVDGQPAGEVDRHELRSLFRRVHGDWGTNHAAAATAHNEALEHTAVQRRTGGAVAVARHTD